MARETPDWLSMISKVFSQVFSAIAFVSRVSMFARGGSAEVSADKKENVDKPWTSISTPDALF